MDFNLNETTGFPSTYNFINNYVANPSMLIILLIVMIVYYFVFSSLGKVPITQQQITTLGKSPGVIFMEVLLWGTFFILLLLNGVKYFFEIDVVATISDILSARPEIKIDVDNIVPEQTTPVPEITIKKQVYHIPNNKYTYENAKALCRAYGSRLASYNEIEDAYKDGGEWCGFGWSKDQLALYPTQKSTYNKLQKIKGHEHDCGRPGINGGYIANKNVRFGANCFGDKPIATDYDLEVMNSTTSYPLSEKDKKLNERIDAFKHKLPAILVAPFNKTNWSNPDIIF